MSFPPRLSLSPISSGATHCTQDDDIFNRIDWPLSDSASFKTCTELAPEKLKEMTHSKAFWNAVMNRWNLTPLVEAWSAEQLASIVSALQDIPPGVQLSPRMGQALEKIFDQILMLGVNENSKLAACVNALKLEKVLPLLKAMDITSVPLGEALFPGLLLDMQQPSQREFLSKAVFCYSSPDRMLPLLNEDQLDAVIPDTPDDSFVKAAFYNSFVKAAFSSKNPRVIKACLKKMEQDFFRDKNLDFIHALPEQMIEYLENPTMISDYLWAYLGTHLCMERVNHKIRLCSIFESLAKPEHQWKLFVVIPLMDLSKRFSDWLDANPSRAFVKPIHERYHSYIKPILDELDFNSKSSIAKSNLRSRLTETDFQIILARVLFPNEVESVRALSRIILLEVIISMFHPEAKKRVLGNASKMFPYQITELAQHFAEIFPSTEIFSLHDAQELAKAKFPFYNHPTYQINKAHAIDPKIHIKRLPSELHGLQSAENQRQIPGDVQIVFGTQTLVAHRVILASEPFFKQYLIKDEKGAYPQKIIIPISEKITENYIQAMVDLAYGGVLKPSQFSLLDLSLEKIPALEKTEPGLKFLVNNPFASDVVFKIGDQKYFGHRAILAARCPYFAKLLFGGMLETRNAEIELTELSPEGFLNVLEFLYTDTTDFTDEVCNVLWQADRFGIDVLRKQCLEFIKVHKAELDEKSLIALMNIEPTI